MTEMKFCTGCQAMRATAGGGYRQTINSKRWVCQPCRERRSASIYERPKKELKAQFDAKGPL